MNHDQTDQLRPINKKQFDIKTHEDQVDATDIYLLALWDAIEQLEQGNSKANNENQKDIVDDTKTEFNSVQDMNPVRSERGSILDHAPDNMHVKPRRTLEGWKQQIKPGT